MRILNTSLVLACLLVGYCWMQSGSDLSILRAEFDVPRGAQVIHYESYPDGWSIFPHEGLDIEVVFRLSEEDYLAYVACAEESGNWLPLPIPEEFLVHMGGIDSARASRVRSYRFQNQPLPAEGSVYNPTGEQLLERFIDSLPPIPARGLFQCRSAGDDILQVPKSIHRKLDYDLNDFMLGVLDHEQRQLTIKVHTTY